MCVCAKLFQFCLTLCNPMDCSPPGSSVHGILQARTLEWVAMPFSRGSSPPRSQTHVSWLAGRSFTATATWEVHFAYSSVYVSISGCQLIPPPVTPVTINLSSTSVTLFLFCKQVHLYRFFSDSTFKEYHVIFVFVWLTSRSCFTHTYSVWQSLGPSMLLQMELFCSFYGWVKFHCIDVPYIL